MIREGDSGEAAEAERILHQLDVLTATSSDYLDAQEEDAGYSTGSSGFNVSGELTYDGYALPDKVVNINDYRPIEIVRYLGAKRRQHRVLKVSQKKPA